MDKKQTILSFEFYGVSNKYTHRSVLYSCIPEFYYTWGDLGNSDNIPLMVNWTTFCDNVQQQTAVSNELKACSHIYKQNCHKNKHMKTRIT